MWKITLVISRRAFPVSWIKLLCEGFMGSHIFIGSSWKEVKTIDRAIKKSKKGDTILVVTAPPGWKYNFETGNFDVAPINVHNVPV